jgi:hypothetical protein
MKLIYLLFVTLLTTNISLAQTDTVSFVMYNLLNFPDGRDDCGTSNVNLPNRTDTLRKILTYLKPDIFVGCEIQTKAGADSILTRSLNVFGIQKYQMASFIPSNGGGGELNNAIYYNSDKLVFLRQKPINTVGRDINQYILYVKDPNLGVHRDTAFIEVYMSHLKAGSGSAEQSTRAQQTQVLRTFVESRPLMRHHFFAGDLNTYRNTEACYQNLLNGGNVPFKDPISRQGSWTNNSSFADVHTQSPRTSGNFACGATGGMDDRFDQILVSNNILTGQDNVQYLANSYRAVGNDGNRFNQSILSGGPNLQDPDSVVNALFYMSDHLPVVMKVAVTRPTNNGLALKYIHNGPLCGGSSNGAATVTPTFGQSPFVYQWDSSAGNQTTATASNLSAGSYCVQVTDDTGLSDNVCFEIQGSPGLNTSIFPSQANNGCDGEATVLVNGGVSPYQFLWNDPGSQTTQTATGLCPGQISCTITDASGCTATQTTTIFGTNSIEELFSNNQLKAYPVPVTNSLNLINNSPKVIQLDEVDLIQSNGKLIKHLANFSLSKGDTILFDTEQLAMGVYFLSLQSGTEKLILKIVK